MRADAFFLLINEIDDALVLEAEGENAAAKRRFPFAGIIAAAACFAALAVGIFVIVSIRINGVRKPNSTISERFSSTSSSETAESTSSTVSKADVSTESTEPAMFFKEPQPEDIVYDAEHNVSYVKNQLLISATLGAPELEIRRIIDELGAEIVGFIGLTNDYQIEFAADKTLEELEAAADYLNSFSYVQSVTLNMIMEINTDV